MKFRIAYCTTPDGSGKYKVVSLLSPTMRTIFEGTYNECISIKNKMGFGYGISKNYP